MKKKQLETLLYSVVGVIAMAVIVVMINFIAGAFKSRIDLTAQRAFTLSAGTKKILKKLDTPVEIRYYFTQGDKEIDPGLKSYAQRVEDLLDKLTGGVLTAEQLRLVRAVEALERMSTPEAREVLRNLAGGAAGALLTREARAALDRLPQK